MRKIGIRVDRGGLTRESKAKEISFPVAPEIQSHFVKQGLVVGEVKAQKRITFMPTHQGGSTKDRIVLFGDGSLCYVSANGKSNQAEARSILSKIREEFLELETLNGRPSNMEIAVSKVTNLSASNRRQVLAAEVKDAQRAPQGTLIPVFEKMDVFLGVNGNSFSSNKRIVMIKL